MNFYRIKQVYDLLDVPYSNLKVLLDNLEIVRVSGTRLYTFHQLFIAKDYLEQISYTKMYFDFDKEEITIIKASKICFD